ncbi:Gfo/Idh/MocA family protein [Cohnella sp. GCM10027633]|uniref:Gfo/Idh/MocA family protein n=1 Tax=unclassified Cohnella TaxID=2636738 RepID=UPI0036458A45
MSGNDTGKPIRVGLAGLGRAGWGMHCEELAGKEHLFEIVAACDPIATRREKMKERYGCAVYETYEELLADPNVELVDITTRSSDHCAHGLSALAAGKHVFMEKPLSLNHEEALRLANAAERSAGELFVRHNRRFDEDFMHVREIIASGQLGDVYEVKLNRHNYQRRDDWQTIRAYGGGQLLNWGPHVVDQALRFLESPVDSVWSDLKRVAAAGDSEDHVKIVMKGENGRVVDLEISGGVGIPSPLYTVYGTRGSLTLTGNVIQVRALDPDVALSERVADPGTPGETFGNAETLTWVDRSFPVAPSGIVDIWEALHASVRGGAPFPISTDEAVEVMRVISAVKRGTAFE